MTTITAPSTLALRETLRTSMARTQVRLDEASAEVATGRHYDTGLALGGDTARLIDLHGVVGEIDAILHTNELLASRLTQTQSAMTAMVALADEFFETLVASRGGGVDRATVVADARARLDALTDVLSSTSNGAYLFSGDNATVKPLADYYSDPPAGARLAVHTAFVQQFGFPPGDAQVSTITAPAMDAYLTGPFATRFRDPAWQADFSSASTAAVATRISLTQTAEIPVSANTTGVRDLVAAFVAVIDSGAAGLDAGAFQHLVDTAGSLARGASANLVRAQAMVGVHQERITVADDRMSTQRALLENDSARAQGVDALEASSRLTRLIGQLDVSFAVTSRLQQLSILNYL
jgi:flagellar hook-associated protein 3 FlgL